MFYWPFSSAVFGITSNLFVGIIVAIWLYFKFCKDYDSDEESEESFEIDDIGYFLNTDTESLATNLEDTHLEPTEGWSLPYAILFPGFLTIVYDSVAILLRRIKVEG